MRQYRIVTLFIIVSLITFLAGKANPQDVKNNPEHRKTTVYFSAITLYHPIVMYQKYQPLMDYLTKNTPYRFELKLSQDYRGIVNFLKTNKVQVALLGGVTYLIAKRELNLFPILKPMGVDGRTYYRCVFITRAANRDINSLSFFKIKT